MTFLKPEQLTEISERTLSHYNGSAPSFWEGTRGHDVSQNINALLTAIDKAAPCQILDFGCGPGRDLMAFSALGHNPVGLEGSANFCAMAREHSGCEVLHQDFLALDLPASRFDGVFANASLFHVPSQEVGQVLGKLHDSLVVGGVLFSSNPRGPNTEGWNGSRYGAYHDFDAWKRFVVGAGFEAIDHFYRPKGLPPEQQPWLASTWRKTAIRSD
jgi:SAM-dependent methyltransferase